MEHLVSLPGPLIETFFHLDSSTIQHADEITNERRTNEELRKEWFWTADCLIYTVEQDTCSNCSTMGDEPILYLTRGKDNPILKNIKEAVKQLSETHNYLPSKEDLEAAINSESTLRFKLSSLNPQNYNEEFSCFITDTGSYSESSPEQKRFMERIYGQGKDFEENMGLLGRKGINKTRIHVLNPKYVKENVPKNGAIARIGGLGNSDFGFEFNLGNGYVDDRGVCLRGALRKIGEQAELEKIKMALDLENAFDHGNCRYIPVAQKKF